MKKVVWLAAALFFGACSGSSPQALTADEFIVDCSTSDAGIGVTSDENFGHFIAAEASSKVIKDACKAPKMTSPASGGRLDPVTPPSFSFNVTPCPVRPGIRARTYRRAIPGERPAYSKALEAALSKLVRPAQAHCGAISGENYYFKVLAADGATAIYSAMLSVTSFTPDAAIWRKSMAGRSGQSVTIVIERAVFLKGDINDGPYAQPVPDRYTVGP